MHFVTACIAIVHSRHDERVVRRIPPEFTNPSHVTANASMLFFTILCLDNPDGTITIDYVTVTFAGM
jgi:hypothetical protein